MFLNTCIWVGFSCVKETSLGSEFVGGETPRWPDDKEPCQLWILQTYSQGKRSHLPVVNWLNSKQKGEDQ